MAVCWHLALCASAGATEAAGAGELMLFDFGEGFEVGRVEKRDVKAELVPNEKGAGGPKTWLRIESGHGTDWPGLTLKAPKGKWDLSRYAHVALDVRNVGGNKVTVYCRVDNPGADGRKNCVTGSLALEPGRSGTLTASFGSGGVRFTKPMKIVGMRGTPGGVGTLDPANVTQLLVFVAKPREDHAFEIANVRAGGRAETRDADTFLPFIDELGQYIHRDWPGKTHSEEELGGHIAKELRDIAEKPGPEDRDRFGGWASEPKLDATGFFRALKRDGRWWLVDPDGRLFWSHGIDCVNTWSGTTPISERKNYFRGLPAKGSPLAQFYGKGSWAPHGYYKGKKYETYKFREANLLRKYGRTWRKAFADITHKRLRSWGMNTIANWSDSKVYLERKTPYVATIHYGA
ncbi:MAG: beta-agarase, partial [Planctomycetota bacterium]